MFSILKHRLLKIETHLFLLWFVHQFFLSVAPRVWCMSLNDIVFVLNDFVNGFDFFFEICEHIIQGHVPP